MPHKYKDYTVRTSARIDTELYNRVTEKLNYGQITILFKQIFNSLDQLIKDKEFDKIVLYINNLEDLTLKINEE